MKRFLSLILLITMVVSASYSRTLDEIRRSGVVRVAFTRSGMQTINRQFAEEFAKFIN
ncbi:MAG: hypothetical protein IJ894_13630 [Bacteroidales bacterium]|nr:hypothetical protein [Bacteroidales bacterium]